MEESTTREGLLEVLVPVAFATMAAMNKIGAENDLSLTLMRVLGILRDRRPRMAELADYLGLKKSTMSGLIDRAEQRGLVKRAPNLLDERATDVFLTEAGAALVAELHGQMTHALASLTDRLEALDQRRLTELLERMLGSPQV